MTNPAFIQELVTKLNQVKVDAEALDRYLSANPVTDVSHIRQQVDMFITFRSRFREFLTRLRQDQPDTSQRNRLVAECNALISVLSALSRHHSELHVVITQLIPVIKGFEFGEVWMYHLGEALKLTTEIERFMKGEFKDFLEERTTLTRLRTRFRGVDPTLGGTSLSNVLTALHTEEQRLVPILQNIQSHMLNAIADINFCNTRGLQEGDARVKIIAAEAHINTVVQELAAMTTIDAAIQRNTTLLKNTHDALVIQLERIEERTNNLTQKITQLTYSLRGQLITISHEL